MNKIPLPPTLEEIGRSADMRLPTVSHSSRSTNAHTTLLAISELNQKEFDDPSDDMRSQVQALQRAIALFRLKP